MLFVVGLGGVMQIRINAADDTYTTARREDLIQLLDGLGAESRRLESEIAELEQTRTELQSGADTQRVAREEAEKRLTELSILAGTVPAEGTGIRMRIADPNAKVDAAVLLDAVEEMRDAGRGGDRGQRHHPGGRILLVRHRRARAGRSTASRSRRPITFEVIGDPHSLEEAARFRGGIVSEITGPKIGGQVQIDQLDRVVDRVLARHQRESVRSASIAAAHAALSRPSFVHRQEDHMSDYPEDLKYSAEHEWVRSGNGSTCGSASPTTPPSSSATSCSLRCRRSVTRSRPAMPAASSNRPRASRTSSARSRA